MGTGDTGSTRGDRRRCYTARVRSPILAALLALSCAACSYDFESVPRADGGRAPAGDAGPRTSDGGAPVDAARPRLDSGFACDPVNDEGCGSSFCSAEIDRTTLTRVQCRGASGSGGFDTFCSDLSFCVRGFVCWADPSTGDERCQMPCYGDGDCPPTHRCDVGGEYTYPFADRSVYRCVRR